jgi:hypothetical protein
MDAHGRGLFGGAVKSTVLYFWRRNPWMLVYLGIVIVCLFAGWEIP